MTVIPVFRKGQWIQYTVPNSMDPLWSQADLYQAAAFYGTAVSQGYSPSESAALAEAYSMKKIYSGLEYPSLLESKLKKIMDRAERA
jgi:hypothetical protein